ncbi:Disease resistance protein [Corchorus olitorius]|uniref:Disease resistance protein n=1 Tax=Corchorus olitorius TaxID=93759 RepID=A0A1R3HFE0_9ROSI|nr:Disease resistance protein [Corchorus olitorius]
MAAALVSAIIQQLATIAAENARQEFKLVTGVKKEVQNLESNFKAIQCVLEDAEERQVVNKSVGYWLERLKQVSYDMDDVLDEWKFALQKLETETDEVDGFCVQMKKKIARAILGGLDQDSTNLQTLQNVLDKICENIESARFLLVLDDVWTDRDEDWQALRATFQQGMPGSRILVTTRKESVAIGLGSSPSQMFPVKQLSDDVCWSILSQVALIRDDDELLKSLEDVGREVAKKCRGLPLAAKTLGSLLREKKNKNEWRNVLNSEFLTKQEIVSKEFNSSEGESLHLSSQLARHLRITIGEGRRFPMSINRVGKLRSLLAIGQKYDVSYEALQSLFNEARCLRILEFGIGYGYLAACVKEIPEDIGKLIHLRYLNLRFSYDLKKLPKATCELRNLQYLNLSGCLSLEELPGEIEKLINLRYLYTRFCHELKYYPKGIRKLTGLRELDIIKARIDCNDPRVFCVGDLENLDLLSGALDLHMEGNTNLGDSWEEEVKRAEFQNKVLLTRLNMTLMLEGRSAEQDIKNNVMQALNLPSNLHPHWW